MGLFLKYSVSVLNLKWEPICSIIKVKHIPRSGELIYLTDGIYYRVINVVHNIGEKQGIFLLVELVGKQPDESEIK